MNWIFQLIQILRSKKFHFMQSEGQGHGIFLIDFLAVAEDLRS